MKVDGLGVVLAIIILPIIMVVTYYVQLQVDTIATENTYNTNLLDATYDALSAFEINTANEELSSVADSMRSIVLASNNVFLNTLATNFGISNASKEVIQPYIPAVLYTMYDGYYIYAPTEIAKIAEKTTENTGITGEKVITSTGYLSVGDAGTEGLGGTFGDLVYKKPDGSYTINKEEAEKETDYVLKSYVQYSGRYQRANKDVTINYTLDNYLNIIGTINGTYYTKTGYLTKKDLVTNAQIEGSPYNLTTNNEDNAKNRLLGVKTNAEETTISAANNASVEVNGVTIQSNFERIKNIIYTATSGKVAIKTMSEAETNLKKFYEEYNKDTSNTALLSDIQNLEYEIQNCKAVTYYITSACFSNWVYDHLSDLTYGDIIDTSMTGYYIDDDGSLKNYHTTSGAGASDLFYNFHDSGVSTRTIFIDSAHPDPEDTESNFNTHKIEVIKNSIKYNLNLSISAYCKMNSRYEFGLPVLLDEEWDKILNNVSIVSFMQGWDCGLDVYNNYQIASSTNNELTVTPSEIYYVKKDEFNNVNGSYHRIDCEDILGGSQYLAFKSKEVKYDKVYDRATGIYEYDHKNLACYTCINTNNYYSNGKGLFANPNATSYYDRINSLSDVNLKRAGYIGIAKERQSIYKTNALPASEGNDVMDVNRTITNSGTIQLNELAAGKMTKLQITISNTKSNNDPYTTKERVLKLKVRAGSKEEEKSVNLDQSKEQTITLDVSEVSGAINQIQFERLSPNYNVEYQVKSIKAIYR